MHLNVLLAGNFQLWLMGKFQYLQLRQVQGADAIKLLIDTILVDFSILALNYSAVAINV